MDWYVLRSHPQKENFLFTQVSTTGIEVFYPRLRVRPANPRSRKIIPYFPGYLFVFMDPAAMGISIFQWMPCSAGLVCFGGEPASVPEGFIQMLKQKMIALADPEKERGEIYKKGELVRVSAGPFAGYSGLFDHCVTGQQRVCILLRFLNDRQVMVELDGDSIEKSSERQPGPYPG